VSETTLSCFTICKPSERERGGGRFFHYTCIVMPVWLGDAELVKFAEREREREREGKRKRERERKGK
jgi:hypothetical protein